jgi:hypothetical protein
VAVIVLSLRYRLDDDADDNNDGTRQLLCEWAVGELDSVVRRDDARRVLAALLSVRSAKRRAGAHIDLLTSSNVFELRAARAPLGAALLDVLAHAIGGDTDARLVGMLAQCDATIDDHDDEFLAQAAICLNSVALRVVQSAAIDVMRVLAMVARVPRTFWLPRASLALAVVVLLLLRHASGAMRAALATVLDALDSAHVASLLVPADDVSWLAPALDVMRTDTQAALLAAVLRMCTNKPSRVAAMATLESVTRAVSAAAEADDVPRALRLVDALARMCSADAVLTNAHAHAVVDACARLIVRELERDDGDTRAYASALSDATATLLDALSAMRAVDTLVSVRNSAIAWTLRTSTACDARLLLALLRAALDVSDAVLDDADAIEQLSNATVDTLLQTQYISMQSSVFIR